MTGSNSGTTSGAIQNPSTTTPSLAMANSGSSAANSEPRIPNQLITPLKLTRENYGPWSFKMELVLKQLRIWDIVLGVESAPGDTADTKDKAEWSDKDLRAQLVISNSIDDSLITEIRDCKTAHAFWKRLEQLF
jgi:hypothetical protein